jgi:hypothetical protein
VPDALKSEPFSLDAVFRQRGLEPARGVSYRGLVIPQTRDDDAYYRFLLRSSRRKLVRRVVRLAAEGKPITREGLAILRIADGALEEALSRLGEWGILRERPDANFECLSIASDFGPTLEWLVAAWLRREAAALADWSVRLLGTPGGGDFDVLAQVGERFFYIECKSGPPNSFTVTDFVRFFRRLIWLTPSYGVVVFDTEESLSDLLARLDDQWSALVSRYIQTRRDRFDLFRGGREAVRLDAWVCNMDWFRFANTRPSLDRTMREVLRWAAATIPYQSGPTWAQLGGRPDYDWLAAAGGEPQRG